MNKATNAHLDEEAVTHWQMGDAENAERAHVAGCAELVRGGGTAMGRREGRGGSGVESGKGRGGAGVAGVKGCRGAGLA